VAELAGELEEDVRRPEDDGAEEERVGEVVEAGGAVWAGWAVGTVGWVVTVVVVIIVVDIVMVVHSRGEMIGLRDDVSFKGHFRWAGSSYCSSCHVGLYIEIQSILHMDVVV
jgi:hypothetical protein